ncbi:MAG: SAM-dependent methyltransferase [Citrobacter freundii]|nr:MAG: SAM-dependent methyltransferase [Citrobacter freundii]
MHSPFVFDFIIHVMNDKTDYADYGKVEAARRQLLKDPQLLNVEDLGAGSMKNNFKQRAVKDIAKHAAKPPKFGQLLYRMVRYYQPENILELGTSIGVTTRYLSLARPASKLITIEGSEEIARVAASGFRNEGLKNFQLRKGNFDNELPAVLEYFKPDFVFIDGNHRKTPTIKYFEQLAGSAKNDTILVFDDIHWSEGMEEAWDFIKQHPQTRCTIDLFFIGIVLFRQEFREKQHFAIRF